MFVQRNTIARVRVTNIAMETKRISIPFLFLSQVWGFYNAVTQYKHTYLWLRDMLCSSLNKSGVFSTDFNENLQYQILRKSVQ